MSRTIQTITAYAQPYGLVCAECGSFMHTSLIQNGAFTRARCLSRSCAHRGLVGEVANASVELLVVDENDGALGEVHVVRAVDDVAIAAADDVVKIGGTQT